MDSRLQRHAVIPLFCGSCHPPPPRFPLPPPPSPRTPLITLDMGGSVAAASWSAFSSSVFVAVTDEGRVHVYDLHVRICHPLCVQGVVQKKRGVVTCIAFSPFHPVILVGGDRWVLGGRRLGWWYCGR